MAGKDDVAAVAALIGRPPSIPFEVRLRSASGLPCVIELAPVDINGFPQSNWFWLVDKELARAVSRLESRGGVANAAGAVSADALDLSHRSHRRTAGRGVGGARAGVKCLHSHLAFLLAGGFSPVGVWTLYQLLLMEPSLKSTALVNWRVAGPQG